SLPSVKSKVFHQAFDCALASRTCEYGSGEEDFGGKGRGKNRSAHANLRNHRHSGRIHRLPSLPFDRLVDESVFLSEIRFFVRVAAVQYTWIAGHSDSSFWWIDCWFNDQVRINENHWAR